jgi:hypothetical protein
VSDNEYAAKMANALIVTYGQEAEALANKLAAVIGPIIAPHTQAASLIAYASLIANALNNPPEGRAPRAMDVIALEVLRLLCDRRHDFPSTPPHTN